MKISPTIIFLLGYFLFVFDSLAQKSFNSSGGDISGAGGTVALTIGEVVYTTNSNSSGSVAQGVQHAYEILTLGQDDSNFSLFYNLFPNPTKGIITLEIRSFSIENLTYKIFDARGKLIYESQIYSCSTNINMNELASDIYILDIYKNNSDRIQSFKIIKN